jgi:hypothetical protein
MRPEPVRMAENAMWKLLLGAAAGLDRAGEMEKFFEATSNIMSTNQLEIDWFLKSKFHILLFMTAF